MFAIQSARIFALMVVLISIPFTSVMAKNSPQENIKNFGTLMGYSGMCMKLNNIKEQYSQEGKLLSERYLTKYKNLGQQLLVSFTDGINAGMLAAGQSKGKNCIPVLTTMLETCNSVGVECKDFRKTLQVIQKNNISSSQQNQSSAVQEHNTDYTQNNASSKKLIGIFTHIADSRESEINIFEDNNHISITASSMLTDVGRSCEYEGVCSLNNDILSCIDENDIELAKENNEDPNTKKVILKLLNHKVQVIKFESDMCLNCGFPEEIFVMR